ncbi:phage portal protein [Nocardioides terrigena]|uniref:phage portal protein n=1 Tax=Nocardioides terrigena TaxID=424797 RepID=UPI000D30C0AD|nr:phage portal protein [Nocardioides terrigena]
MGFWDRFRGISSVDPAQRVLPEPFEPYVSTAGIPVMDPGTPLEFWRNGERSQVEHFWRTQPNVRKVVDFIARNAAIPMHAYERVSDTDRRRLSGEPLAQVLGAPRRGVGPFRFWHSVISDGLLYDRWCILKDYSSGSLELVQVPSWRLRIETDALRRVTGLRYWAGDDGRLTGDDAWIKIDLDEAIFDHGYAPRRAGLSPIETLRDILDESAEAVAFRREVWANGVRGAEYIKRPKEAQWTPEALDRFKTGMSAYQRGGSSAGGVPVLEDGMEFANREAMTSKDALDLDGRALTAIECAAAWHIAPELVGARQGNYSNVREYRQMLYRDSLGPYIQPIEQAINAQLVPDLANGRSIYVEANIESKLRGSFEEQAQIMSTATGAPYVTRNETRARMNMPPIPGGDELVTPLNVLVGGQASPTDSGSQNVAPKTAALPSTKDAGAHQKAATDAQRDKVAEVLAAFFARQGKSVLSAIGADRDWWDEKRWDGELSDDLFRVTHTLADLLGKSEAERLGYSDAYDADQTLEFLRAVADRRAKAINETTKAQVEAAIADPDSDPAQVFQTATDSRASGVGSLVATAVAGFAIREAGHQIAQREGVTPTKTWVVNSKSPRSSHSSMSGETVSIDEPFSNGMQFPGDYGDADEVAGCQCSIVTSIS